MLVYLVFGSPYLAIRLVVDEASPLASMAVRFLLAAVAMAVVVMARKGPRALRVPWAHAGGALGLGAVLLGIGNGFNALGQSRGVSSGVTALLIACVPMFVVALQWFSGQRPPLAALGGIGLGLLGLSIVVSGDTQSTVPLVGAAIILFGAFGWAAGSWGKRFFRNPSDRLVGATYQLLGAALALMVVAALTREHVDLDMGAIAWASVAYLVIVLSMVGFTVYVWLLDHMEISLLTTHTYVNPVVAVALGWAVLGEPLSWSVLGGGALVVVAVIVIVMAETGTRRS